MAKTTCVFGTVLTSYSTTNSNQTRIVTMIVLAGNGDNLDIKTSKFNGLYAASTKEEEEEREMAARRFALCVRGFCSSSNTNAVAPNPNPSRVNLLDTLRLANNLKKMGTTSTEAESVSQLMVEVLDDSFNKVAENFVPKSEFTNASKLRDDLLSKFKVEAQSSNECHFLKLENENTKHYLEVKHDNALLKSYLERMHDDLKKKIEHNKAALSADIQRGKNVSKAELEAVKLKVILYCMGSVIFVSVVGLGCVRICI